MPDDVIISADSHMTEPPDLWVERIDKPFRDRAPRVVREHEGKSGHWFVCEGLEPRSVAGTFAAGRRGVHDPRGERGASGCIAPPHRPGRRVGSDLTAAPDTRITP